MELTAGSVAGVKDEGIGVWGEATRRAPVLCCGLESVSVLEYRDAGRLCARYPTQTQLSFASHSLRFVPRFLTPSWGNRHWL